MKIINPATDETLKEVEVDTKKSIDNKLQKAIAAQAHWSSVELKERIACMVKFQNLLKRDCETLGKDLSLETGKPLQEAINEVSGAVSKMNFFIEKSEEFLREKEVHDDGSTKEVLSYDPLGVICNISAWNYPYLVGVNIFVPALITGNAVLYKPSEFATLTGLNIGKLLHEAGVPEDIFIPVIGAGDVGAYLLEVDLNGYFFTGSYKTGKHIAESVAHKLVRVGLELGGKDPLYVTDEVDVKSAAQNAVDGAFYNNGQSCCAVERIYIHERVYDEFVTHFTSTVKNLKVGDPQNAETNQGAITRKVHLDYLQNQVDDAVKKGATLETGGKKVIGAGSFFEPTVLSGTNHQMELMKEESFGPVIGLMKVSSDDEATALMNDTEYGLTSAVFSQNVERGKNILKRINSGTGYLNCCDRVSGYLPWSGRRHSGLGSALSQHGLYAFTNPKGFHYR